MGEVLDLVMATNLVNCDLVGRTSTVPAIQEAVAAVDDCTCQIVDALECERCCLQLRR